jgi:GNAT superfamily N-acetyltransferase
MSAVLAAIAALQGSDRKTDVAHMLETYVLSPHRVEVTVAEEDGTILGFQSLKHAWPDNPYGVTPGWGVIGSYVLPAAAGRGIGRMLFAATRRAAQQAGIRTIDASIGKANPGGQAFYAALGFRDYRETERSVCKRFDLSPG